MGVPDAVKLLRANLDQETHTSEELRTMLEKVVG
jgi:ferritin-like metal-binding protein YciE